jgi:N-acetylneuraminic acid mutarotase
LFGGNQFGGIALRSVVAFIDGVWSSRTDMPGTGRFDSGCTVVNNSVLCVAGFNFQTLVTCAAYETSGDQWRSVTDLIGPSRYAHSVAGLGLNALVASGRDAQHNNLTASAVFESEVWSSTVDVPIPARARATALGNNGRTFLTGGVTGTSSLLTQHLEFEMQAVSWIQRTPMDLPGRQGHSTFTVLSEQVITAGGSPLQNSTVIYTPTSDTWRSAMPLPLPTRQWSGAASARNQDAGFISGGETDLGVRLLNHNQYTVGAWVTQTYIPLPARKQLMGETA